MVKKSITKLFSLLLVFCMVFSVMPSAVFAEETGESGGFVPKRMFLVGDKNPEGTELAQKVSLIASEYEAKEVSGKMPIVYGDVSFAKEGDILIQVSAVNACAGSV